MRAVLAAKTKTLSDGDALPQAQTCVWGSALENANDIGLLSSASSTLIWGWSPLYAGTASGELDQRYYASGNGRFMTPDPSGLASVNPRVPGSWNRYTYVQGDPVNFFDPTGLNEAIPGMCDAQYGYGDCGGDALFWGGGGGGAGGGGGGGFGNGYAQMQGVCQALTPDQCSGLIQYLGQLPALTPTFTASSPDPNCVQDAITAGATGTGLNLDDFTNPWVQIVGTSNGNEGTYAETELNFSGSADAVNSLITQMCGLGYANNNQCPGGVGNTMLVGPPHHDFTGNFRSPGLTNSVQVNTFIDTNTGTGRIQIDVDPFNPSAKPILGAIFHGVLQVIPNKITGGDNTYGCPHQ